MPIAASDEH